MTNSIILVYFVLSLNSRHLAHAELTTEPVNLAVEPGEEATFTCVWADDSNSTKQALLRWSVLRTTDSNVTTSSGPGTNADSEITLTNSSRVQILDGKITIQNVTFADAGMYHCRDDSGSEPAQSELIVYDMPSYVREIGIIAGVAAALLLVLVVGLICQARREKRIRSAQADKGNKKPYSSLIEREY
ncbi:hypothetical protein PoB_003166400 [Plakobranchus ocellatus]|uniref:Ig-like domain-containing protein n=1 Tax=Plakobranchus ocellatus TaxID=259542 RepID=A0AAV4AFX9_9GAST|nr:hypothetical protein PoB_003166400 [Plakobranchus ocellatus]